MFVFLLLCHFEMNQDTRVLVNYSLIVERAWDETENIVLILVSLHLSSVCARTCNVHVTYYEYYAVDWKTFPDLLA